MSFRVQTAKSTNKLKCHLRYHVFATKFAMIKGTFRNRQKLDDIPSCKVTLLFLKLLQRKQLTHKMNIKSPVPEPSVPRPIYIERLQAAEFIDF